MPAAQPRSGEALCTALPPSHLPVTPRPTTVSASLTLLSPISRTLRPTAWTSCPAPAIPVLTSLPLGAPAWSCHPCPAASAVLSALHLCLSFRSCVGGSLWSQGRGCWQVSHGQRTLSVLCPSFKPMARNAHLHARVHSFLPSPLSSPSRCLLARGHCISLAAHAPSVYPKPEAQSGACHVHRGSGLRPEPLATSHGPQAGPEPADCSALPAHPSLLVRARG